MSQNVDDGVIMDLLFIQDATGSMGKYIESAKNSILEICGILLASGRLKRDKGLQVGLLAYRDYSDEHKTFLLDPHPFTYDMEAMKGYLTPLEAKGGGDRAEAFSTALDYAYGKMQGWRKKALKVIVVVTDAAPHGIEKNGDSFPNGAPEGITIADPIKLAKKMRYRNYSIFTLACEPTLSDSTEFAPDFYKALSDLTLGVFCSLTDPKLLAACIIGSLLEKIDLKNLGLRYREEIARHIFDRKLSVDEVVKLLHDKFSSANQQVTTFNIGNIYDDLPAAEHNYVEFMNSDTLADAKKSLQRVSGYRVDPDCRDIIDENKKAGDAFSIISVFFKNTGSHRMALQWYDAYSDKMCEDIVVPEDHIRVKKFRINVPINFVLTLERRSKNFSRTFAKNEDIDVHQIFDLS